MGDTATADRDDDAELPSERAVAHVQDNGGAYVFALDDYDGLHAAWTAGRAFFTGTGPDGEAVTVKLARVEAVTRWTHAALAHREEVAQAERTRRLIRGDD